MRSKFVGILIFMTAALTVFSMDKRSTEIKPGEGENETSKGKILVVFFSRIDENYGVGYLSKGNTHIIADMITEHTGADSFEIKTVKPYPKTYRECTNIAKQERSNKVHPELVDSVRNMADYDTIFLGYPIWWNDMPMAIYTFLENHNLNGKEIIPFCTHEGSGHSNTDQKIKASCSGTMVKEPFAAYGTAVQNNQAQVKKQVTRWLKDLGY